VVSIKLLVEGPLGGKMQMAMMDLGSWIQFPQLVKTSELDQWHERLGRHREELSYDYKAVSFLREHKYRLFTPHFVKVRAVREYVCSNDTREEQWLRDHCSEQLQKGYGRDNVVTAKTFISRQDSIDPALLGPEYDEVILQKIGSVLDFV